jgi:predicted metalloprotease with PDZ domain
MQIRERKDRYSSSSEFDSNWNERWRCAPASSLEATLAELLDIEVEPGQQGLEVLRIGAESPLCRLRPVGHFTMQAVVERGDQIVAIDGVHSRDLSDLLSEAGGRQICEITIFDHRTRLTVSWQVHVHQALQAA